MGADSARATPPTFLKFKLPNEGLESGRSSTGYDNGRFKLKQHPEMPLAPAFLAALALLADAFAAYEKATGSSAILVGGAAAAIHTDGSFMSADFDVVAGNDTAFDLAMTAAGFVDDEKALHGLGGWLHPAHPQFAVEQVSGGYFDGRADKSPRLKLTVRGDAAIVLPAIEDMIADRLGQHKVAGGDMSMFEQARALYALAEGLDLAYLSPYRRRICQSGAFRIILGAMKTLALTGYLESVNARKGKLAPDSAVLVVESCRNGGARRTAGKRAALERADARAKAASVKPILSNY